MRTISASLDEKLHKKVQAKATDAELSMYARISRGTTALAEKKHLEKVLIANGTGTGTITDVSVAVEHSRLNGEDGAVWACMADGGRLRVFRSGSASAVSGSSFVELDCDKTAVSCSVCFDSVTVRKSDGTYEFVTERVPFVFWADDGGAVHTRKWGANEDTILVSSNALRVSAVRATYSDIDRFDFGLVVFVLLASGDLIYRQRIKGVWYDAEVVSSVPTGVTFTDISAFRTQDYRVGIQGITADGEIYDLFTQYEGIGTRGQEHVEITQIAASGRLIPNITAHPVSAENIQVGTSWGRFVQIQMDIPVGNVPSQYSYFVLRGADNTAHACKSSAVSEDGLTLTLEFQPFDDVYYHQPATVTYTAPASLSERMTTEFVETESFAVTFVPQNLAPVGEWEHIEISGISASGMLTEISYHDGYEAEHVEITGITASGTITEIEYHDGYGAEHVEITGITAVGILTDMGDL